MEFELIINDTRYRIEIIPEANNIKKVRVNGNEFYVTLDGGDGAKAGSRKAKIGELDFNIELLSHKLELGKAEFEVSVNEKKALMEAVLPHVHGQTIYQDSSNNIAADIDDKKEGRSAGGPKGPESTTKAAGGVYAPMPGRLVALMVKVGDKVNAGQVVAILEAMKMENELKAGSAGKVKAINFNVGDNVSQDKPIMIIE
jgi:biotin carboxyl carrier protein